MLASTTVAVLLSLWSLMYLLDVSLKSHPRVGPRYVLVMNKAGLSIHLAQLRWYTASLNRTFVRLGTMRPRLLLAWFSIGMVFGCVAMVVSQVLLMLIAFNSVSPQPVEQKVLVPVMPGVNLPMSQIGYYLLTLLVCGIFHEFGHAIAAVREKVRVHGFGVFIMAMYPGAFVDISTEQLQTATPAQQLRIYCAGVWHNFVIVIVALVTMLLLPSLLVPLYSSGQAAFVTSVAENSPVSGQRGMNVGDHVIGVDGCHVTSLTEWVNCIRQSMENNQHGYCLSLDALQQQDVSTRFESSLRSADCCSNLTMSHLCFSYPVKKNINLSYACLPARSTSERPSCLVTSDCHSPSSRTACVTPVVDNSTRLLRVRRHSRSTVLFYGHPLELYYSVQVSDFIPRLSWLPLNLFYILDTFCRYLVSLSGALALLNVVPCYALDGQWILLAFVELVSRHFAFSRKACTAVYSAVLVLGTVTLCFNIVIAVWALVYR